ncbi:capsular biosynthesis protein [Cupriavidus sp. UME77]|nr:capsular biosynthesis protein [Cupriavidus sp. UME77]
MAAESASQQSRRIILVTTVPETFATILRRQPAYLRKYFDLSLVSSEGELCHRISEEEGVLVSTVPMKRGISILNDLISVISMIIVLRKRRPLLVHSYTPKAGLVTMLAALICRVPIRVHTFTGLIFPTSIGFKRALLIWMDRLICACATDVVPEGVGVKKDLERFQITRKRLRIIGNGNIAGVDSNYFSSDAPGVYEAAADFRSRLGILPGAFIFCFVGRLNRDKGLVELMRAFINLSTNAHLLLVGESDNTAPIGADVSADIASHPRVHSVGFLSDVRPALRAADVLVLPSYREGFPNVVLQAGAMELPVIATDINGCNEVIEPGFNGWLVPPRDAQALERAMHEAIEVPSFQRLAMGRRARERIQRRFEQRDHWKRMVLFYRSLLDRDRRG